MLNAPRVFLDENETDSLASRRLAGKRVGNSSARPRLKPISGNVARERGKQADSDISASTKPTTTGRPRRCEHSYERPGALHMAA